MANPKAAAGDGGDTILGQAHRRRAQTPPDRRRTAACRSPAADACAAANAAPAVRRPDQLDAVLARAVATRAACRRPTLQRLLGFEVELSVPTFGAAAKKPLKTGPTGVAPDKDLLDFFGGGLPYGREIGSLPVAGLDASETIALMTDHNRLWRDARDLYRLLPAHGKKKSTKGLSNLEYSTPALDELAEGSDAQYKALAAAIDRHAQWIFSRAPTHQVSVIPNTDPKVRTGVPVRALEEWLGAAPNKQTRRALKRVQKSVTWDMYIQATAGVLPTGLESLYRARAAAQPADPKGRRNKALKDASVAVPDAIDRMFADPSMKPVLKDWLKFMMSGPAQWTAARGLFMLVLSYVIGDAMNRTNLFKAVDKNAVPLLVKMSGLGQVRQTLTYFLQNRTLTEKQVKTIAKWFVDNVAQVTVDHWKAAPYNASDTTRGGIYRAPQGEGGQRRVERLIMAVFGVDSWKQHLIWNIQPGTTLNPDPVSPVLGDHDATYNQKGIPLEYRWLKKHATAKGQLWPVFQGILAEVRAANLAVADDQVKADVTAGWSRTT